MKLRHSRPARSEYRSNVISLVELKHRTLRWIYEIDGARRHLLPGGSRLPPGYSKLSKITAGWPLP